MLQKFHCEHVLELLGPFGFYQKRMFLTTIFVFSVLAAFNSSNLHLELVPDHWCRVSHLVNFSYGEQHRLIRPVGKNGQLSNCEMYDIDYGQVLAQLEIKHTPNNNASLVLRTKKCDHGWVYDRNVYVHSASMRYNFVCQHTHKIDEIKQLKSYASIGFAIIFGMIIDRYGRRAGFLLMMLECLLSSLCPLFTQHFESFVAREWIIGASHPMSLIVLVIYAIELTVPERRATSMVYIGLFYHLGQCATVLLSILLSDWWYTNVAKLVILVPCITIYVYQLDQTPHWLLAAKDSQNLKILFTKINACNRAGLEEKTINSIVAKLILRPYEKSETIQDNDNHQQQQQQQEPVQTNVKTHPKLLTLSDYLSFKHSNTSIQQIEEPESTISAKCVNLRMFVKRSTLTPLILVFAIILMTNQLTIDSLSQRLVKHTEVDKIELDYILQSIIRIPLLVLTWFLINERVGRRWSNCLVLLLNCILLTIVLLLDRLLRAHVWANVTISSLGIMMAECSIMIIALQAIELAPTRYRATVTLIAYSLGSIGFLLLKLFLHSYKLRLLLNFYTKTIVNIVLTLVCMLLGSFVAETRHEFLPTGLFSSEQLITRVVYWSLAKVKWDIFPSNLQLTLSKWDINCNHQVMDHMAHTPKPAASSCSMQIVTNL